MGKNEKKETDLISAKTIYEAVNAAAKILDSAGIPYLIITPLEEGPNGFKGKIVASITNDMATIKHSLEDVIDAIDGGPDHILNINLNSH